MEVRPEIVELIKESFEIIQQGFHTVDCKSNRKDLVTDVDKKVQAHIVRGLQRLYPQATMYGEENDLHQVSNPSEVWLIDPIDGTANFVTIQEDFGILMAYFKEGVGQVGIMVDHQQNIYHGVKDQGVYKNGQLISKPQKRDLASSFICCNPKLYSHYPALMEACLSQRYYGSCISDSLAVMEGKSVLYLASQLEPWDAGAALVMAPLLDLACVNLDFSPRKMLDRGPMILCQAHLLDEIKHLMEENK